MCHQDGDLDRHHPKNVRCLNRGVVSVHELSITSPCNVIVVSNLGVQTGEGIELSVGSCVLTAVIKCGEEEDGRSSLELHDDLSLLSEIIRELRFIPPSCVCRDYTTILSHSLTRCLHILNRESQI